MTSNKQNKREQQREQMKAARQWLAERFPDIFREGGVPLAIGAHQQAHDAATADPEAPPHWAIQAALRRWVNHPRYWEGLAAKRVRRHLDGTEAEQVTDEQAKRAVKQLKEWRQQQEAKRKQQGGTRRQRESSENEDQATPKVGRTGRPVLTLKGKRRHGR